MENKIKINLEEFEGARMYNRFMREREPSICATGCFDVTNLYRYKKKGVSFNAMMCYCLQQAAQSIKEFHYAIKEDGLYYYKNVKTNAVVKGKDGQLYYPDYKYNEKFEDFLKEYQRVNDYCINNCTHFEEDTGALIGTSAIINYPFTAFSLCVSDTFWDHFILWGKYEKKWFRVKLNLSLRFHHATIDGEHAGLLFKNLQQEINNFKI